MTFNSVLFWTGSCIFTPIYHVHDHVNVVHVYLNRCPFTLLLCFAVRITLVFLSCRCALSTPLQLHAAVVRLSVHLFVEMCNLATKRPAGLYNSYLALWLPTPPSSTLEKFDCPVLKLFCFGSYSQEKAYKVLVMTYLALLNKVKVKRSFPCTPKLWLSPSSVIPSPCVKTTSFVNR